MTLPPSLLGALAPRLASARQVRDSPLTRLYDATAPDGRRFALHVVAPRITDLAGDARSLAATLGELPTLPGLSIPAMEWIAEHEGVVCYATSWHRAVPVSAIDPAQRPSATTLASAGRDLCGELDALHRRGLTHGMITPETLAFSTDEHRFILDGTGVISALQLRGVAPARISAARSDVADVVPEPGSETPTSELRTDMFGLGGTLYQLLTGCPAFGGRTTAMVMAAVLLDSRAMESASTVVTAVTDVILRCLEKDPADRWPDFATMADALAAAARGGVIPAPPHSPSDRGASRLARARTFLRSMLLGQRWRD